MAWKNVGIKAIKYNAVSIGIACVLFLVYIRHIGDYGLFTMLDDEFGYWGNAAYFAGMDWSDVISIIPYYSYGYSLILVPLYWLFDNPLIIYKAAIVINGFLLIASYYLCLNISKRLTGGIDERALPVISMLVFLYPAYLVYSNIAWSECLLIFIFWLLTWCFVRMNTETKHIVFILTGILSVYIYMIHPRTVGVLVASVLTLLIMSISKRITVKQLISSLIPVIILMIVHRFIKEDIQASLWLNNVGNLINDYTRQLSKAKTLLTSDGVIRAVKTFLGHLYALGAASYLIFYFGFFAILVESGKLVVSIIRDRGFERIESGEKCYLSVFLVLSMVLSLAVSIIFTINPSRIDHVVYSRYVDILVGPILLIGLIKLLRFKEFKTSWRIITILMFGLYSYATYLIIDSYELVAFGPQNSVGLVFMNTYYKTLVPAVLCALVFSLITISLNDRKRLGISLMVAGLLFFFTAETVTRSISSNGDIERDIISITDTINSADEDIPVYFLWDKIVTSKDDGWVKIEDDSRYYPEYYQFLLKDRKINFVDRTTLNSMSNERFVITVDTSDHLGLENDYVYSMNAINSYLYYYVP